MGRCCSSSPALVPISTPQCCPSSGSGGAGKWKGGNGATRRIRFLQPMTAAILAGHRRVPNFGMAGGEAGGLGRTWIERADGTRSGLSFSDQTQVNAGDVFVLETPRIPTYRSNRVADLYTPPNR